MEWPSTVADDDAVIVRQQTTGGPRFVVYTRHGPQLAYQTYAEAEARALAYAERARVNAWHTDHKRPPQLIEKPDRAVASPIVRPVVFAPDSRQPHTEGKP